MKIFYITLALLLTTSSLIYSQRYGNDVPPRGEPGKCYAKCLMPQKIDTIETAYPIYIGNDASNVKLTTVTLMEEPPVTESRTRKKIGCIPANSDDCLEKYEVEIAPAVYTDYLVARRPTKVPVADIEYKYVLTVNVIPSQFTEWREVICGNKISKNLIRTVRAKLINEGYEFQSLGNEMDSEIKAALVDYQKKNNLPIGQLDIETLKSLRINNF